MKSNHEAEEMRVTVFVLVMVLLNMFEGTTLGLQPFGAGVRSEMKTNITKAVKAGECPKRLNVVPSKRACAGDSDCTGADKCCAFNCGAVCVPPAFTKPGVCPRRKRGSGMCAEFCVNDNDCPKDKKCCHNGCGHECIEPYEVKPGRCTRPKGTPMCAEFCYHDGQCPGEQKCCRTTCGHACSEPC